MTTRKYWRFSSDGNLLDTITSCDNTSLSSPQGIAIDKKDTVYVADTGNNRICQYDDTGNYVSSQGEFGEELGQFRAPTKLTIDNNDTLYVTDTINDRIQTLSFEDAVASFTRQFDAISCDADSMINDPIPVPPEIALALPISELLSRANNLTESEQFEESLFFYYIASQIEPRNVHVWNGIGYTQTFVCENDSAIIAYQNTLQLDSQNINALNGLGFYYEHQAQGDLLSEFNAKNAELQYQKALNIDPNNINALNGIGNTLVLQDDYAGAIISYQKSLDIDEKRVTTLNGMAFAQLRAEETSKALSFYNKVLDVDKNNFDALTGSLSIYLQEDNQFKVREIIDKLNQFTEQIVASLIAEGQWFLERGSIDEAKRFFEKALELDSDNEIALELLNSIS